MLNALIVSGLVSTNNYRVDYPSWLMNHAVGMMSSI